MIDFRNMTSSEFIGFKADTITRYAEEMAISGDWDRIDAIHRAQEAFDALLPSGLTTTGAFKQTTLKSHKIY
ncbi:MAG: hypothetical protein PHD43_02525 [Methylococcales bacterium]|nr:hypothetical protein [Methylococcales bacterium]